MWKAVKRRFDFWVSLSALVVSIAVACSTLPPPVVTPPNPPAFQTMRVAATVVTEGRGAVPDLTCEIVPDLGQPVPCDYSSGIQAVFTVPTSLNGTGANLKLAAEDFQSVDRRVVIANDLDEVTMHPAGKTLPRLVPVGQYFQREGGERWTVIGSSEFNLLARFQAGEDIDPVLAQLKDIGFNAVRVWTAYDLCPTGVGCQKIGRLAPTAETYAAIPALNRKLSLYDLYAEYTAFTGPYAVIPTVEAKVAHWNALIGALQETSNAMLEMVNEFDNAPNLGLPFNLLVRPTGVLASHGSGVSDGMPLQGFWDYVTYHPGLGPEWMRKVGHNGWEDVGSWANKPVVANETTRFPDNDNTAYHAFDAASGVTPFIAGGYFHSVHGKAAELLDANEEAAARAWVAGAKWIPLGCQGLPYSHPNDGPYLRRYSFGGNPACEVKIRF